VCSSDLNEFETWVASPRVVLTGATDKGVHRGAALRDGLAVAVIGTGTSGVDGSRPLKVALRPGANAEWSEAASPFAEVEGGDRAVRGGTPVIDAAGNVVIGFVSSGIGAQQGRALVRPAGSSTWHLLPTSFSAGLGTTGGLSGFEADRAGELTASWVSGGRLYVATSSGAFGPASPGGGSSSPPPTGAPHPLPPAPSASDSGAPPSPGRLRVVAAPRITGTVRVGKAVRVSPGRWSPAPTKVTYQWFAGTKKIPRATKSRLRIAAKWRGKKLKARVVVSRPGFTPVTVWTRPTGRVR
jgi:hypothetical protein